MESGKRKTTTTTTTRLPKLATAARSVEEMRMKTKRRSGSGSGSSGGIDVINEEVEMNSNDEIQSKQLKVTSDKIGAAAKRKTWNSESNLDNTTAVIAIATENCELVLDEEQLQVQESCNSDSTDSNCNRENIDHKSLNQDSISSSSSRSSRIRIRSNNLRTTSHSSSLSPSSIQKLKKTRSEPVKAGSSIESELRKVNSENLDNQTKIHLDHINDTTNVQDLVTHSNSSPSPEQQQEKQEEKLRNENNSNQSDDTQKAAEPELTAGANACETEEDHVDKGQINKVDDTNNNKETCCDDDQLIQTDTFKKNTQIKSKKVVSPSFTNSNQGLGLSKSTLTPRRLSSSSSSSTTVRSVHNKPTLNSSSPTTTAQEVLYESNISATPETYSKLQTLVDLVMWRDVSRSAFIFGFGTFIIISSSYAKDFNFSFISVASYLSLVYLAVVFLYKSFMNRGVMRSEDQTENCVWGEEEAIRFVKLILPYLNESLLKLRALFTGDPVTTMKLAVVLFVLARCGSSITIWKMMKLGFFGVFVIPKLCSSYSSHVTAYGKFWVRRFQDAWESCSHKKALAFTIFTLVWNYSSVVARAWAAFILFVAFRYYQQSLTTDDFVEVKEQTRLHSVQTRRHLARERGRVPASLDQKKEKKSF
ncbi:reticulon-like protein B21 isoform X1 [Beta vulgaris subsp. vulgaris]|uniref:reticulon-like protein B21 isoform X1 n=1 Tax=Beta vulgaris subsp. vulgaris TaxID=3555 RepID=UPI002036D116|nr:reticulon-like protein B21 isoform X1 [Beta vulgaris subsp. vulgaris]